MTSKSKEQILCEVLRYNFKALVFENLSVAFYLYIFKPYTYGKKNLEHPQTPFDIN